MTAAVLQQVRASAWVFLPQAVSRLSAFFVFAVAANRLSAEDVGVLAIATAVTAASFGLAPAIVGKPLAVLSDDASRASRAPMAKSFAVLAGTAAGLLLAAAALVTRGDLRLTLIACAVGVPAAMVVESHYWRTVFLRGRRHAGLILSAAFAVQVVSVTIAALLLPDWTVVLAPFAGLAAAAVVLLAVDRHLSWSGARAWAVEHRPTWLPYVSGVAAAVVLVQAVPVILAVTAGLAAASVYRAGELLFGGTNLLIGVLAQTLMTQDTRDIRATYLRTGAVVLTVAIANALVLVLLPAAVLRGLVGSVSPAVQELLPLFTVQRAALGLAYVGSILLLRTFTPRKVGILGVVAAGLNLLLLVVGAMSNGVTGGIAGLALAETLVAAYYVLVIRRQT